MRCALFIVLILGASALADEACDVCRPEDEVQVGDYAPPVVPTPRIAAPADRRGRELSLPVEGLPTIRHRPGAGVFVGEAGDGNNLYVDAKRNKATFGLRRDF